MAVDLGDLVESLRREINSPGVDSFPNTTEDELVGHLQDAFWECVLDGLISGFDEDEGVVTPSSGTTDLTRDFQQLVVFYAGIRILRSVMRTINTTFRAKAGPVEYETQQSAQLLKSIFDEVTRKRNLILQRLSDVGAVDIAYYDAIIERTDNMDYGDTWWVM